MMSIPAAPAAGPLGRATRRFEFRVVLVFVLLAAFLVAGCEGPKSYLVSTAAQQPHGDDLKVLVMPSDIELSEISAGGVLEPNAAWTKTARKNVANALVQTLGPRGAEVVTYVAPDADTLYDPAHVQAVKLHKVVGLTILARKYSAPAFHLPTKKDKFDWTLGDSVSDLRTAYDADYALFIFLRDTFSSSGRKALVFLLGVPGGFQSGFASLVNLNSGDVVWFNLLARREGDLRDPERAQDAVDELLSNIPL